MTIPQVFSEMKKQRLIVLIGISLLFGGCTLAPEYTQPEPSIAAEWPEGPAYRTDEALSDAPMAVDLGWREFFRDPKLQRTIEMALENNLDLRLAALNVERVRALYGVQRAELLPTVNVVGEGGKQQTSADLTLPGYPRTAKQFDVSLGITSWEIDFFGRIRSLEEQALQEYLATEEAHRSAQIVLVSEVARNYLTLAADRENLKLTQATFETQQGVHDLIRQQYESGLATELDFRRSQSQVDTARRNVARYTQLEAQNKNALDLLAGVPVPEDLLPVDLADVRAPEDISCGLPSDVLLRRPDILAAENRLKGAYAYIGAARAAFFPRISLTTFIGTASDELSNLFNSNTGAWGFVPQIALPIFDMRTWASYRVSKTTREIALAQYEQAIQVAFREVADVLAVRGTINEQIAAQEAIVEAEQTIYNLSRERYDEGIDSYLGVLDAQRSLYTAQQVLTDLHLAGLANQVRLYAVLGGGGEPEDPDSNSDNRVSGK